jgi:predicted aspartyl protease
VFRYDTQVMPPAPVVKTQVINPLTEETSHLPGKLDTGAAMTVIPRDIVTALHLEQMGDVLCQGYDGVETSRPLYYVALEVTGYHISMVEVTTSPRQDVLLGRDVLNHFTLTLNGKDLTFELRDP